MGLLQAARALEQGATTSEALVRSCLQRIEERNAEVRAFVAVDPPAALAQARAADAARSRAQGPLGLLHGLPFAVKDVIETADLPTAYGSPIYAGHRPRADAACVAGAREQGALVLGKAATSEFATQSPSGTRNPLDLSRTPGGSSSGSAASVGDGMVPVAFGTQTTASIVRPASYCGVVGYKPSYGFFADAGMKPLSPAQDTVGLLARNVADAAFFAYGVHGVRCTLPDAGELRPRLAVCVSSQWQHARAEMANAIDGLAAKAERHGARVRRLVLPQEFEELVELQGRLFAFEARQSLAHERMHHAASFTPRLQQRLDGGLGITPQDYWAMRRRAAVTRQRLQAWLDECEVDALLYPPADGEAEPGIVDSGSARFGAIWSLLHVPCVCVPIDRGPNGLPMGTQVIGRYGDDERVLAVAAFVEQAAGFAGTGG